MKRFSLNFLAAALPFLLVSLTHGQDQLRGVLTMGLGDLATIKQKAQAGDATAQVALGDSLASSFHASEALGWYRGELGSGLNV